MLLGWLIDKDSLARLSNYNRPSRLQLIATEAVKEDIDIVMFSPSGVNWADCTVSGLAFNVAVKTWKQGQTPFPDVIYDRAVFGSRQKEKLLAEPVRKRLKKEFKIPFINNVNSFDKWKTYQTLSNYPELNKYLPDTRLYRDTADLAHLLGKYETVYIKPSSGSYGENIFTVKQAQEDKYLFSYREKGRNFQELLTMEEFNNKFINGKLAGKNVIVQQGITLASFKGRPFDLRVRTQKDGSGKWNVIEKLVRIAAPGSVVTNISSGGNKGKFNKVISLIFSGDKTRMNRAIHSLVYASCSRLEQNYGQLGEIGFDIALEHGGKLWLLEANTKPANDPIGHNFFVNPVKYAKYLSKKQKKPLNPR